MEVTELVTILLIAKLQAAALPMGSSTLQQHEMEAVYLFMSARNCPASLSTGSGKILCFYILSDGYRL